MDQFWAVTTVIGYLLTLSLLPFVLMHKKGQPISTVAWMMAIIGLPYLGSLLFLVFGINRVARRAARKQQANLQISQHLPGLSQYQLIPNEIFDPAVQRLMQLADRVGETRPCFSNHIEIVADTNRTLGLIEQAVLSAKKFVHLEYYIWQPDRTGRRLRDLLVERARSGLTIRFLYDGIGSMWLGRKFLRPMRDAGIQIATFLPGPSFRERWSVNLCNHRKIVIVDGQIGFTGGMNIGDEYIGKKRHFGFWRDTHLRLAGPSVLQLQQVFAEDWFFATGEQLTSREWFPHPEETGDDTAQIISSGPDDGINSFHALVFAALNEAQHSITLATSYFVPTPDLMMSLETAAYRGVQVRLLLAGARTYPWMLLAGRSYYEPLLRSGVEIYEYQGGLLHSKTLTIDGHWSFVGSGNIDTRSLELNFEAGVILYGTKLAAQLEEQFTQDLLSALPIHLDTWLKRPLPQKIGEQFLQLFSPVL